MPDGTLYAGVSYKTGGSLYAASADAPELMSWAQAQLYAGGLDLHGHRDWRVPTTGELKLLRTNSSAIGGFDLSGVYPIGWYWSSTEGSNTHAQVLRFSDAELIYDYKDDWASVRCVRG